MRLTNKNRVFRRIPELLEEKKMPFVIAQIPRRLINAPWLFKLLLAIPLKAMSERDSFG